MTLAAVLAIFVYGLMSALLGAALPSYGLTQPQQGSLAFANAFGLVVATLSAGPFVDWKGKKAALLLGLSLIFLALLAAAHAAFLLLTYFMLGVGGGIVTTGANSLVASIAPKHRGSALNFANLFFGLGGVVTTLAASYWLTPAALCYGIAALAVAAFLIVFQASITKASGPLAWQLRHLPSPTLLALSLLLFFYVSCEVGVWNWLKIYLISLHFSPRTAGGIVSYGFALGLLTGRVVVSRLLLKISATAVLLAASLLTTCATFVMLNVYSRTGVTVAVFCAGLAMAPVFPTTLSLVGDHFPKSTATAMGIAVTSGWIGLAVSSSVVGALAGDISLKRALLLLPACGFVMVLVSLVLYSRLCKASRT